MDKLNLFLLVTPEFGETIINADCIMMLGKDANTDIVDILLQGGEKIALDLKYESHRNCYAWLKRICKLRFGKVY